MNDRVHLYLDQTILLILSETRNESPRVVQVTLETKSLVFTTYKSYKLCTDNNLN